MNILQYVWEVIFPGPKYMTPERERGLAREVITRQMSDDRACACGDGLSERLISEGKYRIAE